MEIVDGYSALFDNLAQSSLFGDWQRLQREAGSADFEESHIFLLLQSLTFNGP